MNTVPYSSNTSVMQAYIIPPSSSCLIQLILRPAAPSSNSLQATGIMNLLGLEDETAIMVVIYTHSCDTSHVQAQQQAVRACSHTVVPQVYQRDATTSPK